MNGILNQVREQFVHLVDSHELRSEKIEIEAKPLSPEEAIGNTSRKDYPLMTGKERLIEARYKGAIGHAFTDSPGDMTSSIGELLALDISDNRSRAFFIASVNAVYRCLFPDIKTVHCRDEDPEVCGKTIAKELKRRFGQVSILLVGLNPAILDNLVLEFGQERVCALDLSPNTIGKTKSGITIRDGSQELQESIEKSDVLLVTGTTLGNGTLDNIVNLARAHEKTVLFYGVTISATASLTGLERICPCAR